MCKLHISYIHNILILSTYSCISGLFMAMLVVGETEQFEQSFKKRCGTVTDCASVLWKHFLNLVHGSLLYHDSGSTAPMYWSQNNIKGSLTLEVVREGRWRLGEGEGGVSGRKRSSELAKDNTLLENMSSVMYVSLCLSFGCHCGDIFCLCCFPCLLDKIMAKRCRLLLHHLWCEVRRLWERVSESISPTLTDSPHKSLFDHIFISQSLPLWLDLQDKLPVLLKTQWNGLSLGEMRGWVMFGAIFLSDFRTMSCNWEMLVNDVFSCSILQQFSHRNVCSCNWRSGVDKCVYILVNVFLLMVMWE